MHEQDKAELYAYLRSYGMEREAADLCPEVTDTGSSTFAGGLQDAVDSGLIHSYQYTSIMNMFNQRGSEQDARRAIRLTLRWGKEYGH
jgi:hypothetical protein